MCLQFEVEAKELELSRLLGEEEVDTKATKEVCLARLVCFVETFESCVFCSLPPSVHSSRCDFSELLPRLLSIDVQKR